jgi:hypothetical protein
MSGIPVYYGNNVPGHTWGVASYRGRRLHLVVPEPWERTALCGVVCVGLVEFTSGDLCPDCAKAAGIQTVADLDMDEDEAGFMAANRGEPDDG